MNYILRHTSDKDDRFLGYLCDYIAKSTKLVNMRKRRVTLTSKELEQLERGNLPNLKLENKFSKKVV